MCSSSITHALLEFAVAADKVVGGSIMLQPRIIRSLNLGNDVLGEHLAQLDAPLIEGIDLPDGALGEYRVLIERDQLAQRFWCEFFRQEDVRRAVALKDAMRNQPIRCSLSLDLLRCLSESQGFGLGKDVGQQHVMVPSKGIEGLLKTDEVTGNQPGSLVDQLVERVLPVGSRLAPVNGAGVVVDALAFEGDVFPVAFHGELLQVGGKAL